MIVPEVQYQCVITSSLRLPLPVRQMYHRPKDAMSRGGAFTTVVHGRMLHRGRGVVEPSWDEDGLVSERWCQRGGQWLECHGGRSSARPFIDRWFMRREVHHSSRTRPPLVLGHRHAGHCLGMFPPRRLIACRGSRSHPHLHR